MPSRVVKKVLQQKKSATQENFQFFQFTKAIFTQNLIISKSREVNNKPSCVTKSNAMFFIQTGLNIAPKKLLSPKFENSCNVFECLEGFKYLQLTKVTWIRF